MDSDMINRLMDIINDTAAKEKVADIFSSSGPEDRDTQSAPPAPAGIFSPDNMQLMLKMQNMLERLNSRDDSRIALLDSMKPFMRTGRSKSIDAAIRFIQIMNFTNGNNRI